MGLKIKRLFISVILIVFISASFAFGFYFGKSQCRVCPPSNIDLSLFWSAYNKLEDKFVDKAKINNQKIVYGAISGMVKSLGDPYTVFFPPQEAKTFKEDVNGSFGGVGMEIGIKDKKIRVIAPLEGTPAKRAGIMAGDEILAVDKKSTQDMTLEKAVNLIRGPKGTVVTLTIFRKGWEKTKKIKITRDTIKIPSLKMETKTIDGQKIIYIKIYQFSQNAMEDFRKVAAKILEIPSQKIVLDLRNNPGGYLQVAQNIAGWFLKKDEVVVIEDYGHGRKIIDKSPGPGIFSDYDVVVLINEGSASASEILAGALRDDRGIEIIGEKSFGKGSVQEPASLRDDSLLKITVAKWLTPKGNCIDRTGLEPDIIVKMTEEDYKNKKDPQLDKALEVIRKLK